MHIGRVKGALTATVKEPQLVSLKLMLVDLEDGAGNVKDPGVVVVDTFGAGVGESVLIVMGSAARLPASLSGLPIDGAVVGIIDEITT
jgi:ethanolamine utilization protein EutN